MREFLLGRIALALFVTTVFGASPLLADKPDWAGKGKPGKEVRDERNKGGRDHAHDGYFTDHQRIVIRDYYEESFRAGNCPPGLAKKHNGCLPPGQAKKWRVGRPLPRDVVYYDLPPSVVVSLGVPPAGHKYVRVASDILLIAVGTGMVVDAIQDLGRM